MNTELIKKKILDLAIRGKLVEQRLEEGTAEELYAQIQEEKKKLITEGKIKKEKPLPKITEDEIPFDIPENWKWVRLKQLVDIQNGDRGKNYPAKETLHEHGIPFISAINLENNTVISDGKLKCLDDIQYERLRAGKLHVNDLVVCIRGSLGKHAKYPFEKGAIASSLVILRKYLNDETITEFIAYYLDSWLFFGEIGKYNNGTAQPNLAANDLEKFVIPLPPLAEQKRIVDKVEEIFSRIDVIEKAKADLAKDGNLLEKKILDLAIRGKLVEQRPEEGTAEELYAQIQEEKKKLISEGKIKKEKPLPEISEDEIPFDIPENWKWVRLSDISEIQSSKRVYEKDYVTEGIPFFRSKEIVDLSKGESIKTELFISVQQYDDFKKKYGVPTKGDILITSVGTLGKTWICDGREFYYKDGNITQIRGNRYFDSKYINYFIQSDLFMKQVIGTVSGTAYNALTIIKLKNILFPLPPLAEQKRIVKKIEELLPYCYKLKE